MRDLDADFARLRDDISGKVVGPPVPELAARGRRRTRRRIVSAGVAAAVAATGFFVAQHDDGTRKPPVVSTISPGPVRTHFKPAGSYIAVRPTPPTSQDLILGASSKDPSVDDASYFLNVPVCGQGPGYKADPKGLASSLSLESRQEESTLEPDYLVQGEQILTFEDEKSADRLMRQLSGDRSCGLAINQISLGDEAFSVTSRTKGAKIDERRAVVVRERTAIAIYWDRHSYPESGATKPALATLADHEANARTMAARLCALGYCADPVYRPVPPGKTLIYWSAAKEGTGSPRWSGISAPGKGESVDQPSRARDGAPTAYGLLFLADPGGGLYRTETLLVGADEATAELVLNKMVEESRRSETAAHTQAKTERLDIGDEAWHFYYRHDDGEFDASTVNTVVVRQGSLIAIYADKAGSDQPPLVQVSQHVRDARTISARLRALGY